jgi:hypothetical protein
MILTLAKFVTNHPGGIYRYVHLRQDDINRIGSIRVSMPKVATALASATLISFA